MKGNRALSQKEHHCIGYGGMILLLPKLPPRWARRWRRRWASRPTHRVGHIVHGHVFQHSYEWLRVDVIALFKEPFLARVPFVWGQGDSGTTCFGCRTDSAPQVLASIQTGPRGVIGPQVLGTGLRGVRGQFSGPVQCWRCCHGSLMGGESWPRQPVATPKRQIHLLDRLRWNGWYRRPTLHNVMQMPLLPKLPPRWARRWRKRWGTSLPAHFGGFAVQFHVFEHPSPRLDVDVITLLKEPILAGILFVWGQGDAGAPLVRRCVDAAPQVVASVQTGAGGIIVEGVIGVIVESRLFIF